MASLLEEIYYTEITVHRQTASQRRAKARAKQRAHRGTNFNSLKPKKGYKRVRVGKNRYVYKKLSMKQKSAEKRVAKAIRKLHKSSSHHSHHSSHHHKHH